MVCNDVCDICRLMTSCLKFTSSKKGCPLPLGPLTPSSPPSKNDSSLMPPPTTESHQGNYFHVDANVQSWQWNCFPLILHKLFSHILLFSKIFNEFQCRHSLKRNRQDDCQYVHDEVLYISSRFRQLSRAVMHGRTDGSFLVWHCAMLITYIMSILLSWESLWESLLWLSATQWRKLFLILHTLNILTIPNICLWVALVNCFL